MAHRRPVRRVPRAPEVVPAARARAARVALVLVLAAACSHGEPYGQPVIEANPPLTAPGVGALLTTNPASDEAPVWLPDGSGIAFSWQLPDHTDSDRCLAFLSLATRRIDRTICAGRPLSDQQADGVRASAFSPGGRVAWVRETGLPFQPPSQRYLMVGPADGSEPAVQVLAFPNQPSGGGPLHVLPMSLQWKGDSTLYYLAGQIFTDSTGRRYPAPLEIGVVSFAGGTLTTGVVPNTIGATSAAVDPETHQLYATFLNDTRVYVLKASTGQRAAVASFAGLSGFPRAIAVRHGLVVAVVQGRAQPVDPVFFGVASQADEGGELGVVALGGGPARLVRPPGGSWFKAPAISVTGDSLVAESYALDVHARFPGVENSPIDTVSSQVSDLWIITPP